MTCEGLARSHRRDAFTPEEHRRCAERDVIAADPVTRGHPPHAGEGHFSRELPEQPPRPAAHQLPHDAGPPCRGEGAVSAGKRRSDRTNTSPY